MKSDFYTYFFEKAQQIKKILGIDNFEAFKKKKKRKVLQFLYKKKFNTNDLICVMKSMGMKKGSIIFIHSSMIEFYNYNGNATELIDRIIEEIGTNGTLLMPAFPKLIENFDNDVDFDVINSQSGAGYLSEVFRKMKGVKRSINLQHSVCAYGKLADHFVSEHKFSMTAWDIYSPYYKMCQTNTLVFALGLPYFLGTIIHCTESLLESKYLYFSQFFKKEKHFKYRDLEGNIGICQYRTHDFARRRNKKRIILKYFDKNQFKKTKISNLSVEAVNAKYTLELFLQLAENGITMYSLPSPINFLDKNGKFIKFNSC